MKKMLISAAIMLVCISTLANAQADKPVPARIEYVFSLAKLTCYRMQTVPVEQVRPILINLRNKFHLTDPELNLYLNFCIVYDQGYQRKELRD